MQTQKNGGKKRKSPRRTPGTRWGRAKVWVAASCRAYSGIIQTGEKKGWHGGGWSETENRDGTRIIIIGFDGCPTAVVVAAVRGRCDSPDNRKITIITTASTRQVCVHDDGNVGNDTRSYRQSCSVIGKSRTYGPEWCCCYADKTDVEVKVPSAVDGSTGTSIATRTVFHDPSPRRFYKRVQRVPRRGGGRGDLPRAREFHRRVDREKRVVYGIFKNPVLYLLCHCNLETRFETSNEQKKGLRSFQWWKFSP